MSSFQDVTSDASDKHLYKRQEKRVLALKSIHSRAGKRAREGQGLLRTPRKGSPHNLGHHHLNFRLLKAS